MSRRRDLAKRLLPDRFVNWYRRKRINILEAAGGATRITPRVLVRAFSRKTAPIRAFFRRVAKRLIPRRLVNWYRRRKVTRQYLSALSYELLERETRLDYLEGRVAARRDGFYERMVHDVLERTELVLQELDRRIEGLRARAGQRQDAVEEQLVQLREELALLRQARESRLEGNGQAAVAEHALEEEPHTEDGPAEDGPAEDGPAEDGPAEEGSAVARAASAAE